MKKTTLAIIERGKDGSFAVFTPNLQTAALVGEGLSIEEAKSDFMEAYRFAVQSYIDSGEPIPEELVDLEFEYFASF